jgi:hypothetical protein
VHSPIAAADQITWLLIGSSECAKCSANEILRHPHPFSEALTMKTDLIERVGLGGTSLLPDAYLLRDLVRAVFSKEYDLCFLTMAHICVALDYFVTSLDARPDHRLGGLHYDLKVISRTKEKFKEKIDDYLMWRISSPYR